MADPAACPQAPLARQADPWRAGPCFLCQGWEFWRSVFGVVRCASCYPPAAEALVAERRTLGGPGAERGEG